ncbi:MAG: cellulase family glycosylhydrolase [Chitinophagaceae bacterium]
MNFSKIAFRQVIVLFSCFLLMVSLVSCRRKDAVEAQLSVDASSLTFLAEGSEQTLSVTCNSAWALSNPAASWLQPSVEKGETGNTAIRLTAVKNETGAGRSAILVVNAKNGQARRITVSQPTTIYPSYNVSPKPADATGMSSNAVQLAAKFRMGWNIGNTMEAPGGESGWGNPVITEEYVKKVKQQGFNAIRLPCSWDWHHISDVSKAKIDPAWMNRVKEVVKYCVDNDVYVLLNIHWDGGWLDHNINKVKKDSINAKQKAYWEQIATAMRDFDEHLMFASANEPPAENAEQMEVLMSYHQTFVDAVRSTGGKNSYRVLVIQGPGTDIEKTNTLMNTMPTDPAKDRLMAEVHFYTPSQFCLLSEDASWGKMFHYWGNGFHSTIEPDRNATWGEEATVDQLFSTMKKKFIDKNIPVIMGEYGAYRRNGNSPPPADLDMHNKSVDHWITYVTKKALENGLKPFWWDTGGALDRTNLAVKDQRTMDALSKGSE